MKKICLSCGAQFETTRGNKIYCHRECGQRHQAKKLAFLSRKLNPDQLAEIYALQEKMLAGSAGR